ncbi:EamA family transporter [Actinokineospora terrae]|uniref:EamA-like transporter family protein n=1 Tax=Actinokineospora terrae TaxID=155974 RepID=A0A1H9T0T1_9PSEU|nr:EamA-like transporter family protein [Actinokineospora terrae]
MVVGELSWTRDPSQRTSLAPPCFRCLRRGVWGVNFTVIEIALKGFPPVLLAALRFALVAVCCLVVPRPKVAWRYLVLVGLFTGTGQYALPFLGMAAGMPPGTSSLVLQAQVLLTLLVAATVLRERPTRRQVLGLSIAVIGLVIVGFNRGGTVPLVAPAGARRGRKLGGRQRLHPDGPTR